LYRPIIGSLCIAAAAWSGATAAENDLCPPGDLLQLDGVRIAERFAHIAEGQRPEGSRPRSAPLAGGDPPLVDLGGARTIHALLVQAGSDDVYTVEGSADGESWRPLAVARADARTGLRSRALRLSRTATVRYLRVLPGEGDGRFHLAKLSAWCKPPAVPPAVAAAPPRASDWIEPLKLALAFAGLALFGWGVWLKRTGRPEQYRRARDVALATLGLLAALGWWNFGSFHAGRHVHDWDQFHYFVGGKYFAELGYDGLYPAATLADLEDGLIDRVRTRTIRMMATNSTVDALEALADPAEYRDRFSDERWQSFMRDVAWFRGRHHPDLWERIYLDHGFNAPPAWTMLGGSLVQRLPATDATILALSLIDTLLLLAMWGTVVWGFGWREACVGLLWWGTNMMADFGWTGGALLRQDWLMLTVVGICLARRGRTLLGGFALGYAALLRVFPVLLLGGVALQVAARVVRGRRPFVGGESWRLGAGVLAALLILLPLSSFVTGGFDGWHEFVDNSRGNLRATGINMVGLMSVLTYDGELRKAAMYDRDDPGWEDRWRQANRELFSKRRPLLWLLVAAFLPLLAWAVRDEESWVALALGIGLIPLGLFVACYYLTCLLGLGLLYRRFGDGVGLLLCLLSLATHVSDWWWRSRIDMDSRFAFNSLATVLVVVALTVLAGRAHRAGRAGI
jgi:hypothetical protein